MLFKKLYTRKAERVKPLDNQPVEVQIMSIGAIDILSAFDISTRGIGVKTPTHYALDCKTGRVDLVITLPGDRPFQATGIVRHVTDAKNVNACFGVEFTQIDEKAIANIADYMERTKEAKLAVAS